MKKRNLKSIDRIAALVLMIVCDMQLLMGLVTLMVSGYLGKMMTPGAMKIHDARYFGMEHPVGMLVAIILVHIGYANIKKNIPDLRKFRILFWCVAAALFIVLALIPWPGTSDISRPFLPMMALTF